MCGIVGYVGPKDALSLIISGLEKLEYRGYDSAGVAVLEGGEVYIARAQGKLSELKNVLNKRAAHPASHIGIGHTRWATHGKPSEENAHPHTADRVSLIHNGIIENYIELREELLKAGAKFKSETDTEIAAHLLNQELQKGAAPFDALKNVCARIRGSYAFVALDSQTPDRLLVAKSSTPIVIGLGEGEAIVASDIPALLEHTRRVVILEDGDLAEVRADGLRIEHKGQPVQREVITVTWDAVTAQKGGYKHFMLKEINEQTEVLADALRGRISPEDFEVDLPEFSLKPDDLKRINRILILGCGTAWHAGLVAKFYIESLAGIPCEVDYASEFRYRRAVFDERTLVLPISQSGETADTLGAIDLVREHCLTLGICNVLGSSLTRKVQEVIYTQAGPEISVASTKAFTTQLVTAYLLAVYLAKQRGAIAPQDMKGLVAPLVQLTDAVSKTLKCAKAVQKVAKEFYTSRDFLFLGRGICYPIALEGALKLKEISYIHAEGYPAGEMKHGPIALIDENMPIVAIVQQSEQMFDKVLSNIREAHSRDGRIIVVTDTVNNAELKRLATSVIEVPHISGYLAPVLLTIPLQLLAYHVAVLNGTDVDLPRNLAKSVTVE